MRYSLIRDSYLANFGHCRGHRTLWFSVGSSLRSSPTASFGQRFASIYPLRGYFPTWGKYYVLVGCKDMGNKLSKGTLTPFLPEISVTLVLA